MNVYYLNNFVVLKHADGTEEHVRLKAESLTLWLETIIERLAKSRLLHNSDNRTYDFNHSDCFYEIIHNIKDMLVRRTVHDTVTDSILKVLISNKEVLISVSQLNREFEIDMVADRLVLILY